MLQKENNIKQINLKLLTKDLTKLGHKIVTKILKILKKSLRLSRREFQSSVKTRRKFC